jgi:predicted enzyme related to lactoylglutathione lyase
MALAVREVRMPSNGHGKICYIEIPTANVALSAEFYSHVFGWNIRTRSDDVTAFDDATGEVSGAFVLGRPPMETPGPLIYIKVRSVAEAVESVVANGCEIVQPIGGDTPEVTARFRDPGGNVLALYQEPI